MSNITIEHQPDAMPGYEWHYSVHIGYTHQGYAVAVCGAAPTREEAEHEASKVNVAQQRDRCNLV